jgi:sugar phosphate isomerase/epimerase
VGQITRRETIASALAPAGAALAGSLGVPLFAAETSARNHDEKEKGRQPSRIVALAHPTIIDATPLQMIDAAVAGGFERIGLRIVPPAPSDSMVPIIGNEPLIRDLLAKMSDTGVSMFDVEVLIVGPDTDVETFKPALETAHRLGAQQVLTCGTDADAPRFEAKLARLAELANSYQLGIGLEFLPILPVSNLAQATETVRRVAQPNLGVLLDVLHLTRSGGGVADVRAADPALLAYCQLCDVRGPRPATDAALLAEGGTSRFYPGEGELALADLFDALPPGLPISIEAPCAKYAGLDVMERAKRCGEATRRFLASTRWGGGSRTS